ncbi:Nucleotide-binding, alpha-beta plait [Cynara cardunculus var. scolymus]|uniref:Nucleotide-binding, alpha-beta plait n=1 Tax=Cynara cardunculus var. scolymus TaxID=59895 RepID=A0A118K3L1_CYNCS|nr:Nucleotide-binding, alpha-beta plait [Cynara cardunculus var. scolymus]
MPESGSVNRFDEKGSLICNQRFVAQTIESLLPDEEDLFSGVLDELGHTATGDEDDEDFDLFSSSGGMEMEGNSKLYFRPLNSMTSEGLNSNQSSSDYPTFGEHPSRTLLVKNVDNRVEDSELRVLFEVHSSSPLVFFVYQVVFPFFLSFLHISSSLFDVDFRHIIAPFFYQHHGDIQTFDTTCRCQGFVIISYYDIRAATIAFSTLQNKPLENKKLHIHYSYPKDGPSGQYIDQASLVVFNCDSFISNDKLHQIFGSFGEIEEVSYWLRFVSLKHIYGTTHHRRIKYYDIRAAEAASNGLNSNSMLQEQIKVEVSHPEHGESLMQQFTPGLVQGQSMGVRFSSLILTSLTTSISSDVVVNSCMKDGYVHGEPSLSEMNVNAFPGDVPLQSNCCFTNSLPSPVGIASLCKQLGHGPHRSTNQAKFHNQFPSFHPQSLPINCEGFVDNGVITYDPVNLASVGFTMETNDKHLHMLDPYGPPMEHMFSGSSGTGSSLLSGHHHAWSCSKSFHDHNPNPVIWSHSPPFDNGVSATRTSILSALSEVLPPVLYTVSPIHTQNLTRSAPSGSLSCKNLQMTHMEESSKADGFLNPLRVVGSPSTMCPPQIISHKSLERHAGTTSPFTSSKPRGRVRRTSHGRQESISCHTDEKNYELDIESVLCGEDCRTTLMIKNIPNKYSSAMLLAAINEQNQGTYDFIYLPLDFKASIISPFLLVSEIYHHQSILDPRSSFIYMCTCLLQNKCNMGYAFINMIDPLKILQFHKVKLNIFCVIRLIHLLSVILSFNGKKWEKFHSGKVACLAYARIQGKDALIAHFQQSSLMNQDKCCHPILFTTDGPNAGNQEPFPLGPSIHTRRHKNGCNGREVNQNHEI